MVSRVLFCALFVAALFAAFAFAGIIPELGTLQSVAAKGKVLCAGKPYKGAKIKLYDVDTTDIDDLLGETLSDEDGLFVIKGSETEITPIDPKLNIYHNCEDEQKECLRKFAIVIPDTYITKGESAAKTFDAGILNLSGKFPGEERDCIN